MVTDSDLLALFRDEAQEYLAELERALLSLDPAAPAPETIDAAFRALHSIKGTGSMFGLDRLVELAHLAESLFSRFRDGSLSPSAETIDLALRAKDRLLTLLAAPPVQGSRLPGAAPDDDSALLAAIGALLPAGLPGGEPAPNGAAVRPAGSRRQQWHIRFRPAPDIFAIGGNPLQAISELRAAGSCLAAADLSGLPPLDRMDPGACWLTWDIWLSSDQPENDLRDIFIFLENGAELRFERIEPNGEVPVGFDLDRLIPLMARTGLIPEPSDAAARAWLTDSGFIAGPGSPALSSPASSTSAPAAATPEPASVLPVDSDDPFPPSTAALSPQPAGAANIKVPIQKLDALVNLAGELVTMHSRYSQLAGQRRDDDLSALNEELDSLARALRNLAMDLHMVPLGFLFSGYQRLVRDLGRKLGKPVILKTSGTDTELEKNIIEQLRDPLLHLIRNAMDHGIETPEMRQERGKPALGTIRLSARYEGTTVVIGVDDDGGGLDAAAILRKAVDRGLVAADTRLSEEEIYNLIFLPGFSTAATVSDLSGRGVGMDVVKRRIESLRGSVGVRSMPGRGTAVQLRIPLTLSVVEALLVRVDDTLYAIDLAGILDCRELAAQRMLGEGLIVYNSDPVRFVDLAGYYADGTAVAKAAEGRIAVFIGDGERRIGLGVDALLHPVQAVIKPLGAGMSRVPGISGAVVLGDGSLALVLDPEWFLSGQNDRMR